jgi:signal transduction histidine kinase
MDDWTREPPTRRQRLWDAATGLALALGMCFSLVLSHSAGIELSDRAAPSHPEEVAWALAVSLPLTVRRRSPVSVLILISIAFIGLQARFVPESFLSSICLFVAVYTAGAWGRDRRITDAARLLVIIAMFAWLAYSVSTVAYNDTSEQHGILPEATASAIYVTLVNILYFGAAWIFGSQSWSRARQQHELAQRTEELKRERDERAKQAVIEERVRIARELHDVVAHHVSVMGVQAGAARRVIDKDPELARSTLSTVEQAGRTAVGEMRRLLGVLRDGDESPSSHSPAPGVEAIHDLVYSTRSTGLKADFTVVGEERNLPRSVSVSCYRIVQEALTNTVRHAGASRVDVRVRYLADDVEVEVVDDGRSRSVVTSGTGLGHTGMRERVGLHRSTLDLGRRTEGGYRVRAHLPAPAPAGVTS